MMRVHQFFSIFCLLVALLDCHAWMPSLSCSLRQYPGTSMSTSLQITNLSTPPTSLSTNGDDDAPDSTKRILNGDSNLLSSSSTKLLKEEKLDPVLQRIDSSPKTPSGIAIVLNTNARGVDRDLVEMVQKVINTKDTDHRVYVTSTKEEARQAAQELHERPPTIVIPVGGDGTLTTLIQFLWDAAQEDKSSMKRMPKFAYIAMGTGNALKPVVGCTPRQKRSNWKSNLFVRPRRRKLQALEHVLKELLQVCNQLEKGEEASSPCNDIEIDIVDLPLLQVTSTLTTTDTNKEEEKVEVTNGSSSASYQPQSQLQSTSSSSLCFFAGVGFDSLMLQDYQDLQEWTAKRKLWKDKLSSVLGYCVALVTRTLPKCVQRNEHLIQVALSTNQPESTVWVDHRRGDVVRSVVAKDKENEKEDHNGKENNKSQPQSKSTLLYQGQAGIVAAGTAPFYGGGLRLFPFARMATTTMHLRVGRIHPLRGVVNLAQIFSGAYRDTRPDAFGCLDFLSTQFSLEVLETTTTPHSSSGSNNIGYPVQHSGESVGRCQKVDFQVMSDPIQFVTLLPPRMVYEEEKQNKEESSSTQS
jgi:hypothetical protein